MNTCSPAMHIIIKLSMTLKLKILRSVLRTVLKLRFSRVRKYFWFRVTVESWPESLKMDSSRAEVCSGDVPCLAGIEARTSFSTCAEKGIKLVQLFPRLSSHPVPCNGHPDATGGKRRQTYSDLEIHKLLRERAHLVIKAEFVLPRLQRREDEVTLALLFPVQDDLLVRARHLVIDVEGTACLNLYTPCD